MTICCVGVIYIGVTDKVSIKSHPTLATLFVFESKILVTKYIDSTSTDYIFYFLAFVSCLFMYHQAHVLYFGSYMT